jgi:hypothetical protein
MRHTLRALSVGVVAVALSGCWYQAGQGPGRTSHNAFESEITADNVGELAVRWVAETDGSSVQDPVVSNAGVHVGDAAESFYGFDTATGERLWTHHLENPGISLTLGQVASDGNRVWVSSGIGNLGGHYTNTWLDAATGADLGSAGASGLLDRLRGTLSASRHVGFGSGTPVATSLVIRDSADPTVGWSAPVYITPGVGGGAAPAVTLGTDAVYQAGVGIVGVTTTPTFGNGIRSWPVDDPTMCPASANSLACPDWVTSLPGSGSTTPVLDDEETTLYTVDSLGTLHAVDAGDGSVLWTAAVGAAPTGTPALAEGVVYVPTGGGIVAVDADGCGAATCSPLWTGTDAGTGGGGATDQPAVAGGVVFTAWSDGSVKAFDAAGCGSSTCASSWSQLIGSPVTGAPAVTGGQVYVATQDGRVIAYGLG